MSDVPKTPNVVHLYELDNDAKRITPKDLMDEVVSQGFLESCNALFVVGVKNTGRDFGLEFVSCANLNTVELLAAAKLVEDHALRALQVSDG